MTRIILTIIFISLFVIGHSQDVSESIVCYKETFNPLFSQESAVITIDFLKNYSLEKQDTVYLFILDIKDKNLELEDISLVTTLFNLGRYNVKSKKNYSINVDQEQAVLNKQMFLEFYNCINKVFSYIAQRKAYNESENNIVVTNGLENIVIGGEYKPNKLLGDKINYYFKIGEINSIYKGLSNGRNFIK